MRVPSVPLILLLVSLATGVQSTPPTSDAARSTCRRRALHPWEGPGSTATAGWRRRLERSKGGLHAASARGERPADGPADDCLSCRSSLDASARATNAEIRTAAPRIWRAAQMMCVERNGARTAKGEGDSPARRHPAAQAGCGWSLFPVDRASLAALVDLGLTDEDIGRYFRVSPGAVSNQRRNLGIPGRTSATYTARSRPDRRS